MRPALLWAALALGLALAGCRHEVEAEQRRVETFSVGDEPVTVEVRADDGSVRVHGRDGATEVVVTAVLRARGPTRQAAERALAEVPLALHQTERRVIVSLEPAGDQQLFLYPQSHEVDLDILVPRRTHLAVTVDNGDVLVRGVEGRLRLTSDNGQLALSEVAGQLILRSDDGAIRVSGARAALDVRTDNGSVSFAGVLTGARNEVVTDNGNVQLWLPADARLRVEARTDRGALRAGLPLQGELGPHRWAATLNPPAEALLVLVSDDGDIALDPLAAAPD